MFIEWVIVCVCFQLDCKNTNITDRCSLCRLLSKRYGSDNMSKSIIERNVKIASFFSLIRIFIFIECTHFILTYFNAMQHKNEKCQNKISKSSHKINESNPLEKRWKKRNDERTKTSENSHDRKCKKSVGCVAMFEMLSRCWMLKMRCV